MVEEIHTKKWTQELTTVAVAYVRFLFVDTFGSEDDKRVIHSDDRLGRVRWSALLIVKAFGFAHIFLQQMKRSGNVQGKGWKTCSMMTECPKWMDYSDHVMDSGVWEDFEVGQEIVCTWFCSQECSKQFEVA